MQSIDLFFQGRHVEIPAAALWALAGFRLIHEQPKKRAKGVDVLQCWFCGAYIDESREYKSVLGLRNRLDMDESFDSEQPNNKRQKVYAPENLESFSLGLDEFPIDEILDDSKSFEDIDDLDTDMMSDPMSDHAPLPVIRREGQSVEKVKLVEVRVLLDEVLDPYRQHERFCCYLNDGGWGLTLQHKLAQRISLESEMRF
jgi:hypothetical protein